MPRFAANISTMFTDRPFAERIQAAAAAGFKAVGASSRTRSTPRSWRRGSTTRALTWCC